MTLNRSNLSVPGHMKKMHAKALNSKADVIMFDLEDSVPVDQKQAALKTVIQSLKEADRQAGIVTVRINAVDTPFAYKEIISLVEKAGEKIDALVVPKINHPGDVYFVSRLLDGVEMEKKSDAAIQIEACIETVQGMENISGIAGASSRVKSLVFGVADYSQSIGARLSSLSGHGDDKEGYPGHRWHYPLSKIAAAAKANNLLALDAPYGDFKDADGLEQSARMAAALGFDGKWVIHPEQINIVNQVFSPSKADIRRAGVILDAVKAGGRTGRGAVAVEGQMVDQATVRLAIQVWKKAEYLGLV